MFEKLELFLEVAKTQNISKAADNLFTSQPAVSMKLKSLETELGTDLFYRTKKHMILTEEGKYFLQYAETIIRLYKEATKTIGEFQDLERGTLSVSSGSFYGIYLLPDLLGFYKTKFPKIELNIRVAFSEIVVQDVLLNKFELGFIGQLDVAKNNPQLTCRSFYEDELILIFSPQHPLAEKEGVLLEDLMKETFIISDESSAMRQLIEREVNKHGLAFENIITLSSIESIKRTVENNLGISILSKLSVKRDIEFGILRSIPIKNHRFTRELYYIYRSDKGLSNAAKEFLNMSIKNFSELQAY